MEQEVQNENDKKKKASGNTERQRREQNLLEEIQELRADRLPSVSHGWDAKGKRSGRFV